MQITKANMQKVRDELSPFAIQLLRSLWIEHKPLTLCPSHFEGWFQAILELIKRNVCRADYNILDGKYLLVLQPGGKKIIRLLEKETK